MPPVAGTCEPHITYRSSFTGAVLPVCGVEVLIVVVQPRIISDVFEANLYVTAFSLRFRRTIVLMSQDDTTHAPTYYGPAVIVRALTALPFEMLPWQRMLYRVAKPRAWQLPIPPERSSQDSDDAPETDRTGSYSSSVEELARTRIRDRETAAIVSAAARAAASARAAAAGSRAAAAESHIPAAGSRATAAESRVPAASRATAAESRVPAAASRATVAASRAAVANANAIPSRNATTITNAMANDVGTALTNKPVATGETDEATTAAARAERMAQRTRR